MIGLFLYLSISTLPEFMLDSVVIPVGAPNYQGRPSVASDGIEYLAAWEDLRNNNDFDIYCTRVTSEGIRLDTNGILVSLTSGGNQEFPSIAFDGTNYLVVWQDTRNGNEDIYGSFVTPLGTVINPSGIPISTSPNSDKLPSIAFDGTNYLIAWEHYDSSSTNCDIYGVFVSPEGNILNQIRIAADAGVQVRPSIAFDGTNYLVAWQRGQSIYCGRVTTAGTVLDPHGIFVDIQGYFPSVAFGSGLYLISWISQDCEHDYIFAIRVTPDGVVLGPLIELYRGPLYSAIWPKTCSDTTNFLVVYPGQHRPIYGRRVSPDGVVIDPPIQLGDDSFGTSAVALNSNNYFVVWESDHNGDFAPYRDVYGTRVTPDMNVLDPQGLIVSSFVNMQSLPAVGTDGANYLAAWTDGYVGSGANLCGIRITPDGTFLDTIEFVIPDFKYDQYLAAVGYGGANYLVAWSNTYPPSNCCIDMLGSRVTTDGIVLDPEGIGIASGMGPQYFLYPSIAFDGTRYFVVWEEVTPEDTYIGGRFITQDGVAEDLIAIWIGSGPASVAFGTDRYLVVWPERRNSTNLEICGSFVTPTGVVAPIWNPIIVAPSDQELPQITFDGTNYFVVWQDNRNGNYDIYGARVSQSGVALDPGGLVISGVSDDQIYPSVVFDGTNYIIIWQDKRSGIDYDIYGARVTTEGVLLDTSGVELINQATDRLHPKISRGPAGRCLIVYQGFVSDEPYNTWRVFGALWQTVGIKEMSPITSKKSLLEIYPNPFRKNLTINYALSSKHYAQENKEVSTAYFPGFATQGETGLLPTIRIYDATGRLVKSFLLTTNYYLLTTSVAWNGTDDYGRALPAGIYFVQLETDDYTAMEKVILLR